ncbi:hypothetical protein CTA2_8605, partial [Colletotrichum tanaceti]
MAGLICLLRSRLHGICLFLSSTSSCPLGTQPIEGRIGISSLIRLLLNSLSSSLTVDNKLKLRPLRLNTRPGPAIDLILLNLTNSLKSSSPCTLHKQQRRQGRQQCCFARRGSYNKGPQLRLQLRLQLSQTIKPLLLSLFNRLQLDQLFWPRYLDPSNFCRYHSLTRVTSSSSRLSRLVSRIITRNNSRESNSLQLRTSPDLNHII